MEACRHSSTAALDFIFPSLCSSSLSVLSSTEKMDASTLRWASKLIATPSASLKGDKVALPQSILASLIAQAGDRPLPYPLTFKIVNPTTLSYAHCVPREFSAEEGQVELSSFLRESLG